ncbi:MAG: T9SS type A sorting domain-containing protein, partial [Bacteroidota bacterium]
NENNKEENFGNIYPNPARDYVFVSDFEGEIKIFDLIGNLVLKAETKKNLKIDVSGLDTGLYFVKINNKMGKFIKL